MTTGVLLTIDTELAWRHHAAGASWQQNFERSIEPAGVGITYQLRQLAKYGLKATFFVDPMPALVFGIEPIRQIVETVLKAGQEVQLHCHPAWAHADRRTEQPDRRFEISALSEADQLAMIEQARELLCAAGAPPPTAFRAGSFGANPATLAAVRRAGLAYDSSQNGSQMPWPCATGLPARLVTPFLHHGLIEVPIGLIEDKPGTLRHLQIGAVSTTEVREALLHAESEKQPLVTLVSHSFELVARDGLTKNHFLQRRFDLLCAWLAEHRARFPTQSFADLDRVPLNRAGTPAPLANTRRIARVAEQGVSNLVYERRI